MRESIEEATFRLGQPPGERAGFPAELGGRHGLANAFEATEHERGAFGFGQPVHFLVHGGEECVPLRIGYGRSRFGPCNDPFAGLAPCGGAFQFRGHTHRDAVQPRAERGRIPHGLRTANERQKCRLKRILGIAILRKEIPTHAPNHRPVTAYNRCERGRIVRRNEPRDERGVGLILARHYFHLFAYRVQYPGMHGSFLRGRYVILFPRDRFSYEIIYQKWIEHETSRTNRRRTV